MNDTKAVGKIRTSYGVKGELKFLSYSGSYEHFNAMTDIVLKKGEQEKTACIETIRWCGNRPLLKIRGIDQPEIAKTLADFEIWVHKNQVVPLQTGEYYLAELIGCSLIFDQHIVASITGYLEGGATELLEVRRTDGRIVVIPFMDRYLGEIDLMNRTIELRTQWIIE